MKDIVKIYNMPEKINYELTILVSPELNQEEAEDFLKKIDSSILGIGEVLRSEKPKKINLSYLIKNRDKAFLTVTEFKTEPAQIETLKSQLEKEKDILRFLLIRKRETQKKIKRRKIKKEEQLKTKPLKEKKKVELDQIEEKLEEILKE